MSDVQIDNETKEKYDENSRKILKKFIEQLNSCNISKGEYPKLASADLKYTAMLQSNRLREKNVDINYNYITENAINTVAHKLDKDTRYIITRFPFYMMKSTTEYSVNGQVKKKISVTRHFLQMLYGFLVKIRMKLTAALTAVQSAL